VVYNQVLAPSKKTPKVTEMAQAPNSTSGHVEKTKKLKS
jgi:hypothetical protein